MLARCLLGLREESMLPFIARSGTKADWLSSEHGVVATGEHDQALSCCSIEGFVRLLCDPEAVEHNCQLAGDCHHGLVPGLLAAASCQVQAPLSTRGVFSARSQDVVAHSIRRCRR